MNDADKTKEQLLTELAARRRQNSLSARSQTQYKHGQAFLQDNSQPFYSPYENIALSYQALDENGRLLYVNQVWADTFGYVQNDVIGRWFGDFLTPDSRVIFKEACPLLKSGGQVQGVEVELIHREGSIIIVLVNSRIEYEEDGRFQGVHCILTDITERKQMELSLQQTEHIINQSGVIVFLWQAKENWPVEFVSENIRSFGYEAEAFYTQQTPFAQLVHPDDLERVLAEVNHYNQMGIEEFDQEYRIITQSGEMRWVDDHTIIRRDQDGRITHYQGVVQDITARKEVEAALRSSEARYRQMFESHSSMQWLVDPKTQRLVDVNPAAANFYGYTREQMRQMNVPDLNILSPQEISTRLSQAKSNQRDYFMVPHRLASGEIRQMEIHSGPINVRGRPLIYAILHDITERLQAEESLRQSNRELALLNQARQTLNSSLELDQVLTALLDEVRFLLGAVACSIWLVEAGSGDLVCCQVTEPARDIMRGWRLPAKQGIAGWVVGHGQSLLLNDAQNDPRHFKGVDAETTLTTRSLLCVPLQVKTQIIGVVQALDTSANTFKDSDLTLIESLAATAATAIENAQLHERLANHAAEMEQRVVERTRELVAANEQLQELDRLKTKLIEDISHELRTPVANLSLYLDLLERGKPERQTHYKAVLRDKMNELVRLTEDVLKVFRLDLFQGNIVFDKVDLKELIQDVLKKYQMQAQEAGLTLHFEPAPNLPHILAEPRQLQQAIANLVANAVNYTTSGTVTIKVAFEPEGERVCLSVADTGMGIPPEEMPYIFDRFYRGQKVGQLNMPGTGLGLSVVKDIISLHNGTVEVESRVDKGTVFRVWLPVGGSG